MIYPAPLMPGDKVGLIAPAGPVVHWEAACNALKNLGLTPVMGRSIQLRYGYLAGEDTTRAEDLQGMFQDKTIKGIFAARGGYGSQRILDKVDWDIVRHNPKVFAGYSDITAVHTVIQNICGFVTYHSPMPAAELCRDDIDKITLASLKAAIFSARQQRCLWQGLTVLCQGRAEGILTGGNLSVLVSSLGTPYELDACGKILFIEEVAEEPYRVDRMLTQLKNAGKFREAAGIILGSFTKCVPEAPEKSLTLAQVFEDLLGPVDIPCYMGLPCGHRLPTLTLPLGALCRMAEGGLWVL